MSKLRELYQKAFEAFACGDYASSIAGYQEVIAADASFALGYQGMAEAYARAGQLEPAIAAIRNAIRLDPGEPLFHTSLSRFLQQQGHIPEAEEAAAAAARLQSKPVL